MRSDADERKRARIIDDNARADQDNAAIELAIPDGADRFVSRPTLEEAVGIGRNADNKPARMAAVVDSAKTRHELPAELIAAVQRLDELDPAKRR